LNYFGGQNWVEANYSDSILSSLQQFVEPQGPPLVGLDEETWALELFHGPTLAFKDYALVPLAHALEHKLKREGNQATVLCATSGDTGAATAAAFAGRENTRAVILFPAGRVSEVQRKQMTTMGADNILVLSVQGDFDDCQRIVKQLYQCESARNHNFTAVNSINLIRILLQTTYYFKSAFKLYNESRLPVNFIVPTGNFGNIFAGYIAKQLGAPINRLVIASNENDILPRLFVSGEMVKQATQPTIAPSMDIQISSNFERMLWLVMQGNGLKTNELQRAFETQGSYQLSEENLQTLRQSFAAVSCDTSNIYKTIAATKNTFGRTICPHSATAYHARTAVADTLSGPTVLVETAHAAKFPYPVSRALQEGPKAPDALARVFARPERCISTPASVESIEATINSVF